MILQGLKPRIFNHLNKFGKQWLRKLPVVIWSLRTMRSQATRLSPFFLDYGSKVVLPTDLEYRAPRIKAFGDKGNEASLWDALDQLEEARDVALLHSAKYQQSLWQYHARRIHDRAFSVGDLVLRMK
jgi:hypothetical protein